MRGFAVVLVVLAAGCAKEEPLPIWVPASWAEVAEIEAAVGKYLTAAIDHKGTEASAHVTASTLAAYEKLRVLALHASRADLETRGVIDRVRVVLMRAKYSAEQLEQLEGRMFERFVDDGLINAPDRGDAAFEDFGIDGESARAVYVGRQRSDAPHVQFRRENGNWRIDLESLNIDTEPVFTAILTRLGGTTDEAIVKMVSLLVGRTVDASIWTPPRPR